MNENRRSDALTRRDFLKTFWMSLAAAVVLAGCRRIGLPIRTTPTQVQFSTWGQENVTFAELDLPFKDYAFESPAGYRRNNGSSTEGI